MINKENLETQQGLDENEGKHSEMITTNKKKIKTAFVESELSIKTLDQSRPKYRFFQFYNKRMETDYNDRKNFIKKVYFLLSMQLAYTTMFVGIVVGVPELKNGIKETFPIVIVFGFISLLLCFFAICCINLMRKYPQNYVILILFTISETYILSFLCSYYSSLSVLSASFITLGTSTSLAFFVHFSKSDFTVCKGIGVGIFSSSCFFAICLSFAYSSVIETVYALIAVMLYSVFIVYDLQLVAGGRYDGLNYDDYAIGTMILYIDIIGLMISLLRSMKIK